jgi:hypothetical protein
MAVRGSGHERGWRGGRISGDMTGGRGWQQDGDLLRTRLSQAHVDLKTVGLGNVFLLTLFILSCAVVCLWGGYGIAIQMRSLVFQPEGGEIEPESRCRVNWDIKLEQVKKM